MYRSRARKGALMRALCVCTGMLAEPAPYQQKVCLRHGRHLLCATLQQSICRVSARAQYIVHS